MNENHPICKYFAIHELVCPHVYQKYGERAWQFMDPRLLDVLLWLREGIGEKITINDYEWNGNQTQSGIRCNMCNLVKSKTDKGIVYMSAHIRGSALDPHVHNRTVPEVWQWIRENIHSCPHNIRVEDTSDFDTDWLHIDVVDTGRKLYIFKP